MSPTVIPPPAVFPFEPDGGFAIDETWTFATDVLTSRSGAERRVPLVQVPRIELGWTVTTLAPGEAANAMALMRVELDNRWIIPRWPSARRILGRAGSIYTIDDMTGSFFVVGGTVLLWNRSDSWQTGTVTAIGTNTVTVSGAAWTLGGVVVPCLLGSYAYSRSVKRPAGMAARFEVAFSCDVTNLPLLSAGTPTLLHRGVEVLTEVWTNTDMDESWSVDADLVGGGASAPFLLRPLSEHTAVEMDFRWIPMTRLDIAAAQAFLARRRGRYAPVWVAGSPEVQASSGSLSGENTLRVRFFDYAYYFTGDISRRNILLMVSGAPRAFGITSWVASGDEYVITLDAALTGDVPKGTLISFLKFARLASDSAIVTYLSGFSAAEIPLPFVEIPGEAP
jgi:hypothetical protein